MTREYKKSHTGTRGLKRFGVTFPDKPTERETLRNIIEQEKRFIKLHATMPRYEAACDEALGRQRFYEKRLAELEAVQTGPQEPPQDERIFNRKQADGTYRPLSEFFDVTESVPVPDAAPKEQTLEEFQALAAKYALKPFVPKPNCEHAHEYPTLKGWQCRECHRVREAANDFERSQVSRLTPRGSGWVNYGAR